MLPGGSGGGHEENHGRLAPGPVALPSVFLFFLLVQFQVPRLCASLTPIVQRLVGPAQRCSRGSPSCALGFLHDVLDRPPLTYRQFHRRPLPIEATQQLIEINTNMLQYCARRLRKVTSAGWTSPLKFQVAQVTATLLPLLKQLAQQCDLRAALSGRFPNDGLAERFELSSLQ